MDRKAMSKRLEGTVRELLVTALRGRPIPVESASWRHFCWQSTNRS